MRGKTEEPLESSSRYVLEVDDFNPLPNARVFLAHAEADHGPALLLRDRLAKVFSVFFDPMLIGDALLALERIEEADFFLFLASSHSMEAGGTAFSELRSALGLTVGRIGAIGFVSLDGFEIPSQFRGTKYLRLRRSAFGYDADRLVEELQKKLLQLGGFRKTSAGRPILREVGGAIRHLRSESTNRSLYPLAATLDKVALDQVLREIKSVDPQDQERIVSTLLRAYSDMEDSRIRQNAAYLLGRLRSGDSSHRAELVRRLPDVSDTFLFRGVTVALSFLGDRDVIGRYANQVLDPRTSEWKRQRSLNLSFHDSYYGSRQGALRNLRTRIDRLTSENLLPLDVVTLGMISEDASDLDLLEERALQLEGQEVDSKLIARTIDSISRRVA